MFSTPLADEVFDAVSTSIWTLCWMYAYVGRLISIDGNLENKQIECICFVSITLAVCCIQWQVDWIWSAGGLGVGFFGIQRNVNEGLERSMSRRKATDEC